MGINENKYNSNHTSQNTIHLVLLYVLFSWELLDAQSVLVFTSMEPIDRNDVADCHFMSALIIYWPSKFLVKLLGRKEMLPLMCYDRNINIPNLFCHILFKILLIFNKDL